MPEDRVGFCFSQSLASGEELKRCKSALSCCCCTCRVVGDGAKDGFALGRRPPDPGRCGGMPTGSLWSSDGGSRGCIERG